MNIGKIYHYIRWERFRINDNLSAKINYSKLPAIFLFYDYFNGINQELIKNFLNTITYQDLYFEAERNLILGCDHAAMDLLEKFSDPYCDETVVHVHIPKSAGTSLNHCLHEHFYGSINFRLPGNNTPHLLRFFFEHGIGRVPFLTTSHVPLDLLLNDDHNAFQRTRIFFVDRDETDRLESLRNQLIVSIISFNFFNRPFAYFVHLKIKDFMNYQVFPNNHELIYAKEYCLASFMNHSGKVEAVPLQKLRFWLNDNFGLKLAYLKKNKTVNLAIFLPRITRC